MLTNTFKLMATEDTRHSFAVHSDYLLFCKRACQCGMYAWKICVAQPTLVFIKNAIRKTSDVVSLGDSRGGECADTAPCCLPPPAGWDPGGLLWVPKEAARSLQLPRHQGLRRHTLLPRAAADCWQVHPAQFPGGKTRGYTLRLCRCMMSWCTSDGCISAWWDFSPGDVELLSFFPPSVLYIAM